MKIAQIAPLMESVPPRLYGGTERIVSYLTEELVRQGHEVTLFASGNSTTTAELVPGVERALRLDGVKDPLPYYAILLDEVRRRAPDFDILHFHIDYLHFPLFRAMSWRAITTLHGRQDLPDLRPLYSAFSDMPVTSISLHQRRPLPQARWVANVPHGLPVNLYPFTPVPRGGYLAFLGRISPEKQPDQAIAIARRSGLPLKIAAKVDKADQEYFEARIRPLLDQPGVEYVGEIGDADKAGFLGNAAGLLFPIAWPEPFGLVMIEAMACGTPVLAYRSGSVPEIVHHGVTGFVVEDLDEAAAAVAPLAALDRAAVRRSFERRFSAERMARDYVATYRALLEEAPSLLRTRGSLPAARAGRSSEPGQAAIA